MRRRQTIPRRWLVVNGDLDRQAWYALRRQPVGSGVLLLRRPNASTAQQIGNLARLRSLTVVTETPMRAARVHNLRELMRALLRRTPIVFLSPMFETLSHPDWHPIPKMRAAAFARLADRRLIALGGMNSLRHSKVAQLGFIGWAGISAWNIGR